MRATKPGSQAVLTSMYHGGSAVGVLAFAAGLLIALNNSASPGDAPEFPNRWVFLHSQLAARDGLARAEEVMRTAARAGYNGVVLTDSSMTMPGPVSDEDRARAGRLRSLADQLGMEIIPTIFSPTTLLSQDPNLVEAMPVRDVPFVVHGGLAELEPDPLLEIRNGGFDAGLEGWTAVAEGGAEVFADTAIRLTGTGSVLIRSAQGSTHGSVALAQTVRVRPWRQYVVSVYARTSGFAPAVSLQPWILNQAGRTLNYSLWQLKPDADWTALHAVFNSQESHAVELRFGVNGFSGSLWLDTVRIEEVGLLNLARRDGCPLVVSDEGGSPYEEGRDFEPVADPQLGRSPSRGAFTAYHSPPPGIRLTAGSRIREGARLRVSYYACPVIYESRVTECLSDPRADTLRRREAERIEELLRPRTWFMSHDEMRVMNWCETCRQQGKTPGQLLADNVRRCTAIVRAVHPGATVAVWSDMFDPQHNMRSPYYFVNGPLTGSVDGLDRDVLVVNWNSTSPEASLKWFANRGHRQIIAAYYDRRLEEVGKWLEAARGVPGVEGIMYTTWKRDFSNLQLFATRVWGQPSP